MDLGFAVLVFSLDSMSLVDLSFGGKFRTWDAPRPPDDAVGAVCRAVGRNLADAEWDRYASDRPRSDTCH